MGLVNKKATKEAIILFSYLNSIQGKKIISGQHTQTKPQEELKYIYDLTGKKPALVGFELLGYSPNINPYSDGVCLKEVYENRGTLEDALAFEGIVELTWHWFSPMFGKGKSFYQENTKFDASKVLEKTPERTAFFMDLDIMANILKKFYDIKKPVIWRPFHEADGKWFWWGAKGDKVAKELYLLMFDYFVNERHLDNLIWAWSSPSKEGYPGDNYVDIVSRDIYTEKHSKTNYYAEYKELINNTSKNKIVALTECGVLPDIDMLKEIGQPWVYFMTWSKEFILTEDYNYKEDIKKIYQDTDTITLEDFKGGKL